LAKATLHHHQRILAREAKVYGVHLHPIPIRQRANATRVERTINVFLDQALLRPEDGPSKL